MLFLITLGGGIFGTVYFYKQNQKQIEQNVQLQQQANSIQMQLDTIGQMTVVYEVNSPVRSGSEILDSDLREVSIPVSALEATSITDKSQLVGKCYKIAINRGTILTQDLIMEEFNTSLERYQLDIPVSYFPVGLFQGDYIDIRMALPNGEIYIVMEHKKVQMLQEESKVLTVNVSEEESWVWQAALADIATYGQSGAVLYITKYLNPGLDTNVASYYPVQEEMSDLISINPNIEDASRLLNPNLRAHINEVLFYADASDNQRISSNFKSIMDQQGAVIHTAYVEFVEKFKDEEGNVNYKDAADSYGEEAVLGGSTFMEGSFDEQVGEAMDSIEQSVSGLGGL